MKFNGKTRKYEYKDITTLGLYLLDNTENENPLREQGIFRSMEFDIYMSEKDYNKFTEDIFVTAWITPAFNKDNPLTIEKFCLFHGIVIKPHMIVEDEE